MATYTLQRIDRSGLDATTTAVAAADDFVNDGKTFLFVDNADAAVTNVTFDLASDPHGAEPTQSTSATNIAVPAGESRYIGPFPTGKFGTSVTVNYSNQTAVTAAAIAMA